MKTKVLNREELYRVAGEEICSLVREKPDAVIAMAAGRTMIPLWDRLQDLELSRIHFFEVAEFLGAKEEKSLRAMTENALHLNPERSFWLTEENYENCDAAISAAGGLDLAVLGIGVNAHIGFNEPATPFDSQSRKQKLSPKTREQYAWRFDGVEQVPAYGITLGIQTICRAKKILVLATGEEKAKAVFDMLYARDDSVIPAAFLQIPSEVTVYVDPEAAKKL